MRWSAFSLFGLLSLFAALPQANATGEDYAVLIISRERLEVPTSCEIGVFVNDQLAGRLLQAVRSLDIAHERSPMGHVTISVGVASLASGKGIQIAPRELVDAADAAMYLAKEQGRDRAVQHEFPRLTVISTHHGGSR